MTEKKKKKKNINSLLNQNEAVATNELQVQNQTSNERKIQKIFEQKINELSNSNDRLHQEIQKRTKVETELLKLNTSLEETITKRTQELLDSNIELVHITEIFETIQKMTGTGIWEINLKTNAVYWSDKIYEIHEIEIGTPIILEDGFNYLHPDYRPTIEKAIAKAVETGIAYDLEVKLVTQTGKEIWVRAIGLPILNGKKVIKLRGLFQNIDELKNRQIKEKALLESLKTSETRFKSIVEYSAIGIALISVEGEFLDVNNALCRTLGYNKKELQGVSNYDVTHKEDRAITKEKFAEMQALKIENFELHKRYYHKNGSIIWVQTNVTAAYDSQHKLLYYIKQIQDITGKRKQEKERKSINKLLEHKVLKLNSINEELNAFSYSVSHDLRSPLRSISGFSLALKEDYYDTLDELGKNYLERISKAAIRMGRLIDDLLDLSRISKREMVSECIDITSICTEIINDCDNVSKYVFDIRDNLNCNGDVKLITIALENLINNAIKYSSKIDNPIILIGEKDNKSGKKDFFIRDNGAGFDPEYADKLFGAFQRLHGTDEFEGAGIGLATVKRIITKHGGTIWAESHVNKGATFYFNLND